MFRTIPILFVCCLMTAVFFRAASPVHGDDLQYALIDVLESDASTEEKADACRELKLVGGVESVPALAKLLANQSLSHEARVALESMPCAEASTALRQAIARTTGTLRLGIVDSIGERRDEQAAPMLAKLLSDTEPPVVMSAALALGKIGTPEAARLLSDAYVAAPKDRKPAIGDGLVRCADRLLDKGKLDAASTIYERLSQPSEPPLVRASALRGVVQSAGNMRADKTRKLLASDDPTERAAVAIVLPDLSGDEFHAVATEMGALPMASQIAVVTAVRFRGDSSLTPLIVEAVQSENRTLARAAIAAIGTVAGEAGVDILVPLTIADEEFARTAWESLARLRGGDVNAKIVVAMQAQREPTRLARFIELLVERNAYQAVSALIQQAGNSDANVRSTAIAAIQQLATPSDVSDVVSMMLKTRKGRDRDELEKAVMLAVGELPEIDERVECVVAAIDRDSRDQRVAILPLLGRIGGPQALEVVQSALRSGDGELYSAGVRAISNWPDAGVAGQLRELAENARQNTHRISALRALIRVITLPSEVEDSEKLGVLKQAMAMASRDEERVLVLQRASAIRSVDTLQFLLPYLDKPEFAQEACVSVVELAHHKALRDPNQEQFDAALKKVLTICRDGNTIERAKRYLQGL